MSSLNTTAGELAERLGGTIEGDSGATIAGIASLDTAGPTDVTFVADKRRAGELAGSAAAAAIVDADLKAEGATLIRVPHVNQAVAAVLAMIGDDEDLPAVGVHPTAGVAGDARIDPTAAVGPGVVVGSGATVGAGAVLCINVVVEAGASVGEGTILLPGTILCRQCVVGAKCRIGPTAVIGSSGFGYEFDGAGHQRLNHVGHVEIGNEVDVGACSCIDRGKFGVTRIGDGTKIDNLVQVAHNVQVGRGCVLAALVGVAGSARLKDFVVLGGNVGVRDNITIGSGARVGACSCIAQDVPDGGAIAGYPAIDASTWLRSIRQFSKLSEMNARIRELEKKVRSLESATDD